MILYVLDGEEDQLERKHEEWRSLQVHADQILYAVFQARVPCPGRFTIQLRNINMSTPLHDKQEYICWNQ